MTEIFSKNEHHMHRKKPDQFEPSQKWDSTKGAGRHARDLPDAHDLPRRCIGKTVGLLNAEPSATVCVSLIEWSTSNTRAIPRLNR
jgi:hypothetical protein